MKDVLSFIVSGIVDNKDAVSVSEELVDQTHVLHIAVANEDVGKVIGKQGRIIRAIRNVMKIPAIKQEKLINVVLETPDA